jgi:signal transduction histidine kinase
VATEIGEAFPHWEVGVYLLDPSRIARTAGTVKWILGLLVLLLTATIGFGGWVFVADLNRQLNVARKKTDFVSNVSHELKTPLTSIRMFTELLAENRVVDPARRKEYLGIINAEAARLTRLINNVLDFAKMERGEKNYRFQACDLAEVGREVAETLRPHLEHAGFRLSYDFGSTPLLVRADRDAISQVIVNLLSNAEKYSGERKEIQIRTGSGKGSALLSVQDRGPGVPHGCQGKIFEQFYRAHDSLSSGIPGTGLGLTLARQIARAHGGDVVYSPRDAGGSEFTLSLPSIENGSENENHDPDR